MDEKKVKETIEDFKEIVLMSSAMGFDITSGQCDLIIEALEKQLAKKPIEVNDAYTPKIGEFRVAKCPNCGHEVSDRFDVCLDCGQKLDWSEQESEINA